MLTDGNSLLQPCGKGGASSRAWSFKGEMGISLHAGWSKRDGGSDQSVQKESDEPSRKR